MPSRSTRSTFELFQLFPDQASARLYLEERRWRGVPVCPHCGCTGRITARKGKRLGYYRCRDCGEEFTVRTGSIFGRSHVPLHKWVYAMYLVVTSRKGISSLQLSKEIGVQQKTAWFILGRLREACGDDIELLRGIVEVDEVYIGGLEQKKHESKKTNAGRGPSTKQAVLGIRQRGGKSVAVPVDDTTKATLQSKIAEHVETGAMICTDEHKSHKGLESKGYAHGSVKHSTVEYVGANDIHVNSAESMWAVFRRGLYWTWHHCSRKHLARDLNEATFRLNEGSVKMHTLGRLTAFTDKAFNRRITYKELTA
ncbi:MAG: IS1595 family transposase [Bryobacterales bacterium]|nr:IS1595 family transposase [Bryobacterales bacterium]